MVVRASTLRTYLQGAQRAPGQEGGRGAEVTLTEMKEGLKMMPPDVLAELAKQGSVWYVIMEANDVLWVPAGAIIAERVCGEAPLQCGLKESIFYKDATAKEDLESILKAMQADCTAGAKGLRPLLTSCGSIP